MLRFRPDMTTGCFSLISNGGLTPDIAALFDRIPHEVIIYRGSGWDIGAHQFASLCMPPDDWVMCFSSWAHFRKEGWLRSYAEARDRFGDGLYGSTSAFEYNLHLRGTGFFVRCERMHRYPHGVNSREESFAFEIGTGFSVTMVPSTGLRRLARHAGNRGATGSIAQSAEYLSTRRSVEHLDIRQVYYPL